MFNLFENITPIYLIFLFYGAAFLFLGVSIAAKNMKGSELQLADSLWLLGAFGFLHGAHEWMELGPLIEGEHLSFQQLFMIKLVSAFLVVISFLFLLWFGISLFRALGDKRFRWAKAVPAPLFIIWALYAWYFGYYNEGSRIDMQSIRQINLGARYTFGFVGGMMTAYGLIAYSHEVKNLGRSVSKKLYFAGSAFSFYAVFAGLLSSWFRVPVIEVPVVVFRGILGILITYLMTKALNIFDIETRKKIEQQTRRLVQTEKLASLGQLAAGIAHEINNPLTNASLGIQTLRNKLKTGGERDLVERLDAVERNIDRASSIAQELLQFSRQKETEFAVLNINDVLQGALTLMQFKLHEIEISRKLAPVPDIMGDSGKLEQVFINILSNSLEAMPEGGAIAISTEKNGNYVLARIADTGAGIPEKKLSRVFDPFFTTKEIGAGTGLGLSICYGIIQQHHGFIDLHSAAGKGTTVTIKLPLKEHYDKNTHR